MLSRRFLAVAAAAVPAVLVTEARAQNAPAESTMDRVQRTKVLRIAALPGEAPYFNKDIATGAWSGMCVDMAKDIAGIFDGQVEYLESTYGNSVLDLQSGKIDLAFALNPTPKRAWSSISPTRSTCTASAWSARRGSRPTNWSDLDKPEVKVACRHRLGARDRGAPLCPACARSSR